MRFVYWLLIAIYTFAALAQGALTGDELVCAAAAVPALVLSAPVGSEVQRMLEGSGDNSRGCRSDGILVCA